MSRSDRAYRDAKQLKEEKGIPLSVAKRMVAQKSPKPFRVNIGVSSSKPIFWTPLDGPLQIVSQDRSGLEIANGVTTTLMRLKAKEVSIFRMQSERRIEVISNHYGNVLRAAWQDEYLPGHSDVWLALLQIKKDLRYNTKHGIKREIPMFVVVNTNLFEEPSERLKFLCDNGPELNVFMIMSGEISEQISEKSLMVISNGVDATLNGNRFEPTKVSRLPKY